MDKLNGNLKFSGVTNDACSIKSSFGTSKAISLLGYAAKHDIVSKEKIIKEINERGGEIRTIHYEVKFKCDAHREKTFKAFQEQQKETDKQKQNEIKIDRSRGMIL